jgi:hypothetical protein
MAETTAPTPKPAASGMREEGGGGPVVSAI